MFAEKITYGQDKMAVDVCYKKLGKDLQVLISAGKIHIGATALAVPCQMTPEGITASVSIMTVPGHRDDVVAGKAALELCKALGCSVCVTAGLHIDQATQEEILTLVSNAQEAIKILIKNMRGV